METKPKRSPDRLRMTSKSLCVKRERERGRERNQKDRKSQFLPVFIPLRDDSGRGVKTPLLLRHLSRRTLPANRYHKRIFQHAHARPLPRGHGRHREEVKARERSLIEHKLRAGEENVHTHVSEDVEGRVLRYAVPSDLEEV